VLFFETYCRGIQYGIVAGIHIHTRYSTHTHYLLQQIKVTVQYCCRDTYKHRILYTNPLPAPAVGGIQYFIVAGIHIHTGYSTHTQYLLQQLEVYSTVLLQGYIYTQDTLHIPITRSSS
jgi:hypothetical protein